MRFSVQLLIAGSMMFAVPTAAKTIDVAAGHDANARIQEALILAQPGDTVMLGEGTFNLTDGLSLDVAGVTLAGHGTGKTLLDFAGQMGAGEGLLVTSDDVTLRDFSVLNSKGDGIKSKGADRIVYYHIRVEWTGGPAESNGAYGIYPVESEHVLIDSCYVRGASDAGIYVGQSKHIVVRGSLAIENVAGIEIENSMDADVHDNLAAKNAGGILIFDLPNLPQMGGRDVRIFDNLVIDNSTPNFAPKGNIVANVPTGTGVMVMANRNISVFDNVLQDNGTANVMLIGYRYPQSDERYDPLPRHVAIFDNMHVNAGFAPKMKGGEMIAAAMGGRLPPIVWDGAGEAATFVVGDDVPVLSLGLTDLAMMPDKAAPSIVKLDKGGRDFAAARVTLPRAMEDKVK